MKHLLYTLLGILLLAGCKEDKYNVIIPMSDIYLSAPQDGAKIDLNDLSIDEYSFSSNSNGFYRYKTNRSLLETLGSQNHIEPANNCRTHF